MTWSVLGGAETQLGQISLGTSSNDVYTSITDDISLSGAVAVTLLGREGSPPFPQVRVKIAFEADPSVINPNWTDVTQYLQSVSIRRGRSHELDRFETGTASISLRNVDRRFEPNFDGSPYYPYVKPLRRVQITAELGSHVTYQFSGFTESWQFSSQLFEEYVTLNCSDVFKTLARRNITSLYPEERSDERIHRILDDAGFTRQWWSLDHPDLSILGDTSVLAGAGDDARVIGIGSTDIQEVDLNGEPALTHLQDVTQAENGRIWVRGDGAIVFLDRQSSDEPVTYVAIYGDRVGELLYRDLTFEYSDDLIYNEVRVTREGGVEQIAADSDSIDEYLTRTLARNGMLMTTDLEAEASAQWLLSRYKQPFIRFNSMTLEGQSSWGLWDQLLVRDIGDQILVRRRPGGSSAPLEQQCVIEGISHDIDGSGPLQTWTTNWTISPAFPQFRWILDDDVRSILGDTTILSY